MKIPVERLMLVLLMVIGCSAVSCTSTSVKNYQVKNDGSHSRHPISVALVIPSEMNDFTLKGQWTYKTGPALRECVIGIAKETFQSVRVVDSIGKLDDNVQAYLLPRVTKDAVAFIGAVLPDEEGIIFLEWTLKGADGRETIWVNTVKARHVINSGKNRHERLVNGLLDDLYAKSVVALADSKEIRALSH